MTDHEDGANPAGRGLALALANSREEAGRGLARCSGGAIEPHESHAGISAPPLEAWAAAISHGPLPAPEVPPCWADLVLDCPRTVHIVFVPGDFPQRLDVGGVFSEPGRPCETPKGRHGPLRDWAERQASANALLHAAGILRMAGDADGSLEVLKRAKNVGAGDNDHANLMGALAFDSGNLSEARRYWESLPDGPARWHNLGLAALVTGTPSRALFEQAANALDEADPWHHLAALYMEISPS
jgi:hypothetical protein